MSRSRLVQLVFTCLLFMFGTYVPFQAHEAQDIYVESIWARPCQDGDSFSSVFMTIDNTTVAHPIALIGATSPIADEIRLVEGDGGCSEASTERIIVPFGERLDFQQAKFALVVHMNELHQEGEAFSLTLTFDMLDEALNSEGMTVDVVVGVPILEQAPEPSEVLVVSAWTRPTSPEALGNHEHSHDNQDSTHSHSNEAMPMVPSAVYMRLLNRGAETLSLVAVSSTVADISEIHQTTIEDDISRMGKIEALELPVEQWIALEPGGYHIMLINLKHDLLAGEAIPLTLQFESGETLSIAVPVYDASMGGHEEHQH